MRIAEGLFALAAALAGAAMLGADPPLPAAPDRLASFGRVLSTPPLFGDVLAAGPQPSPPKP